MKKINWFSRLFMSWNTIKNYVLNNSDNNTNILEEKTKLIEFSRDNKWLNEQNESMKSLRDEARQDLENEKKCSAKLEDQIFKIKLRNESLESSNRKLDNEFINKNEKIQILKNEIMQNKQDYDSLNQKIYERLNPLKKIERTFFAESGNKGKGELGEKQIKCILEKAGLPNNFWTENLMVGKNQVEFAIKSGENNKWVPVDSKVLSPDFDISSKTIIMNDRYKNLVMSQAKEMTKYLNKSNTTPYGLLVLQSDNIYLELYYKFPQFFQQIINNYKIHICSPASFVQFAWSVSYILDIYKKVNNDEKIYNEMLSTLTTITKLSKSLLRVHEHFNIAMSIHFPTLQTRQNKLVNKLVKDDKIKPLDSILVELKEENKKRGTNE